MSRGLFFVGVALFSLFCAGCPRDQYLPPPDPDGAPASVGEGHLCDCPPGGCDCCVAEDCPGMSSQCVEGVACENHKCVPIVASPDKPIQQIPGDCRVKMCDPTGKLVDYPHPGDVPNDGNPCTNDLCEGVEPVNEPLDEDHKCEMGAGAEGVCKLDESGEASACVACIDGVVDECGGAKVACDGVYCVPDHCVNNEFDYLDHETDDDCGGPCTPCLTSQNCSAGSDCLSGVCAGGECIAASHSDGVKNFGETGVDCGCDGCSTCPDGQGCKEPSHCASGVCFAGECQPAKCFDELENQGEEGVDCGGPCALTCD